MDALGLWECQKGTLVLKEVAKRWCRQLFVLWVGYERRSECASHKVSKARFEGISVRFRVFLRVLAASGLLQRSGLQRASSPTCSLLAATEMAKEM